MSKINIGLFTLLIVLLFQLLFSGSKNKHKTLVNDLEIIKSTLIDIDNDIHELDEKINFCVTKNLNSFRRIQN